MKQNPFHYTIVTLLTFSLISLAACTQQAEEQERPITEETKHEEVAEQNPITKFRIAIANLPFEQGTKVFACLDNEMKAKLWQDRLMMAAKAETEEKKQAVLSKMSENITADGFTEEGSKALNEKIESWLPSALEVFNNDSIKVMSLLVYLDDLDVEEEEGNYTPEGEQPVCDCSIPSDLCHLRWPFGLKKCINFNCIPTPTGCGWLWQFPCDALCAIPDEEQ